MGDDPERGITEEWADRCLYTKPVCTVESETGERRKGQGTRRALGRPLGESDPLG